MINGRSCVGFAYLGPLDDVEEAGVNLGADGHGPSGQLLTINHSLDSQSFCSGSFSMTVAMGERVLIVIRAMVSDLSPMRGGSHSVRVLHLQAAVTPRHSLMRMRCCSAPGRVKLLACKLSARSDQAIHDANESLHPNRFHDVILKARPQRVRSVFGFCVAAQARCGRRSPRSGVSARTAVMSQ
jgi:hypothetical protein